MKKSPLSQSETDTAGAVSADCAVADGIIRLLPQAEQLKNPDAVIVLQRSADTERLAAYADAFQGSGLGDVKRYRFSFWEIEDFPLCWDLHVSSPIHGADFSGMHYICKRRHADGTIDESPLVSIRGRQAWGRDGVAIAWLGTLPASRYLGSMYDNSATVIAPKNLRDLPAIYAFCKAPEFHQQVRLINQKMQVANATMVKVPFDLDYWQKVAAEKYPDGLPEPQSDDPTQWIFHGHPAHAEPTNILQVAVARLAGYRWPAEVDDTMRLASEARVWVDKCRALHHHADDDGVVPLVPMRGEPAAEGRIREVLREAFGGEWSSAKAATLLAGANTDSLDDWLKNRFFAEHCSLFHNRPFVWHIWDGRKKDGFGVLVDYHRLAAPKGEGRRLLEKITHGYLGDWIARQRDEMKANKAGADARLASALDLQKKLEAILAGEPPYDIFVRWKRMHEQPIGWEPDLNDGVRMNIRPFVEAGILRDKINIKWTSDHGQEPKAIRPKADFPWFWDGTIFTGDRVNDVHLTVAEKQAARAAKGDAS